MILDLITRTGIPYKVDIPADDGAQRRAYLFAYPKSGSTLLFNMMSAYCDELNIPWLSVFDAAFAYGVSTAEIGTEAEACFRHSHVIYTGFRHFPKFMLPLDESCCVLLVRDPRDMLVSMYYSIRYSHAIPERNIHLRKSRQLAEGTSIDEFVLQRAETYLGIYNGYKAGLLDRPVEVYRYEDVVFRKQRWLAEMVQRLELPEDKRLIRTVAKKFDVIPPTEQVESHIRQVKPGDYLSKLDPSTITILNRSLSELLDAYGYSQ